MDYSYCGYQRSEQPIPTVKAVTFVQPTGGDDAALLQAAIDFVSKQKPDKQTGMRGAVLLSEGTFTLNEPLRIRTSGVVLRGSGRDKTVLVKKGYDRGALLYIEGTPEKVIGDTLDVADIKAGDIKISLTSHLSPLTSHDRVMIIRPSTQAWIDYLDCASFGGGKRMGYWAWHPGDIDLRWHRTIQAVNRQQITLDAPITCSTEERFGGAKAVIYQPKGLLSECGIENLSMKSDYDHSRPLDEDHCWSPMLKIVGCEWSTSITLPVQQSSYRSPPLR